MLKKFVSALGRFAGNVRSFFSSSPEAIRSKSEARIAAENAENERVNARRIVLNEYVRVKGEAQTTVLNAKTARIEARGQARIGRTHARQNFFTVLLDHWARYRLARQRDRTARIYAKADAKAKRRESKIAYKQAMQELETREQVVRQATGFRILPSVVLVVIAIWFAATIAAIAFDLNFLWPLLLWLTFAVTIYSITGWKMKIINFTAISAWAILVLAYFTN